MTAGGLWGAPRRAQWGVGPWTSRNTAIAIARALLFWLLVSVSLPAAASPWWLFGPAADNAGAELAVYEATEVPWWPRSQAQVDRWATGQQRLRGVDFQGGTFWLRQRFRSGPEGGGYVVMPGNTFFHRAEVRVYGPEGVQSGVVGIGQPSPHVMHQGVPVALRPDTNYDVLVRMETPLFTSLPRVDIYTDDAFTLRVRNETLLFGLALGGLLGLGVYNLLIGAWTRSSAYVYYGGQSLALVLGWGYYFGLPYQWFGWQDTTINYSVFFIALTALHAGFCRSFLQLPKLDPKLSHMADGLMVLSAIGLLGALTMPSTAHLWATILVGLAIAFAVGSSIWALLNGVTQARFMLAGYLAILIPGVIILPANLGMMEDLIDNADLLVLIGNAVEAMLLAVALADRVKSVEASRETFRVGMQTALRQASTDPLTGLQNRYAFNLRFEEILDSEKDLLGNGILVAMIDLDGLKTVNDQEGHAQGDALLCAVARGLREMAIPSAEAFRLGGDEYAVVLLAGDELSGQRLARELQRVESEVRAMGFPQAGLSFGIATSDRALPTSRHLAQLLELADQRMYENKAARKALRAGHRSA